MALDLSGVSETQLEDVSVGYLSNCVLLSSEVLSLPGTSDILFYITDVGHLVLANFLVEQVNGNYFLRKNGYSKYPNEECSNVPTNLCMDKCDTSLTYQTLPGYFSQPVESNLSCKFKNFEPEFCSFTTDVTYPNNAQVVANSTQISSNGTSSSEVFEQPFDATVPRLRSDTSVLLLNKAHTTQNEEDCCQEIKLLGRKVRDILIGASDSTGLSNRQDLVLMGHNFSELERFVKRLRQFRRELGLSQIQLSNELARHFNNKAMFSQTLLSRFEKLDVTARSAFKLLPYIRLWMSHTEQQKCVDICERLTVFQKSVPIRAVGKARVNTLTRLGQTNESVQGPVLALVNKPQISDKNAAPSSVHCNSPDVTRVEVSNSTCQLSDPHHKRIRRKRTHFSDNALSVLAQAYAKNSRPTGSDLSRLAMETGHDRESVRIWFCNRRQLEHGQTAKVIDE